MTNYQKFTLALVAAFAVAMLMISIEQITGWDLGILVGWFPITALFGVMEYIKCKEGKEVVKTNWKNTLVGFFAALALCLVGIFMKTPNIIIGIMCGLIYNVVIYVEPRIKKKE